MKPVPTSSMRRGAYLGLALLLCAGTASAQMYKWVDANGKTHFTDQPPPASAKPAQIKASTGSAGAAGLPYALAQAARNYPVTLYTTASCSGCDQGRTLLKARGIPFSEKTVTTREDEQKLKEAAGNTNLPVLIVGSAKANGFHADTWTSMLNVALYPETKMLPASYQYPQAVAAAPKPVKTETVDQDAMRVAAAAQEEEKRRKEAAAKAKAPTAPPGFQF
jgi:glutaredoxin